MDLKRLNIFATVAETGTMSRAADRLFISQPTVSQTISELETHYQTKLFERFPKGLSLTESGQRLLTQARSVLDSFAELERSMCGDGVERRFLRLGATLTVGSSVMSHLATALKQQNSGLDLYVLVENTRTIETKLLENQLDAALIEGETRSQLIMTEPVINDCLILVCGPHHHLAHRESVALTELANEVFLMREIGSGTRVLFENVMRTNKVPYRIGWESSSVESIKQAVIHNQGLAVLSGRLVARELASGEIRFIPVCDCLWKRHFLLAWHRDKVISDDLKTFMDLSKSYEKYGLPCPMSQSDLLNSTSGFHLVE